jgi:hypothetical protein
MAVHLISPPVVSVPIKFDPKSKGRFGPPLKICQDYNLKETSKSQKRFEGMCELHPGIDLSKYECVSVIDFLKVVVKTDDPIDAKNLLKKLRSFGVAIQYIDKPLRGSNLGFMVRRFIAQINEPTPEKIMSVLSAIKAMPGVHCDGEIEVMEVSVDIYPRDRRDRVARLMMSDLLKRHIRPEEKLWRYDGGWPRCVGPAKKECTMNGCTKIGLDMKLCSDKGCYKQVNFLVGNKLSDEELSRLMRAELENSAPAVDETLYFGPRETGPAMLRVMDKVIDNQNRNTGKMRVLPVEECRSRTEVELRKEALKELGVEKCGDLFGFDFQTTRKHHFQFALPLFPLQGQGPLGEAVAAAKRKIQLGIFMRSGVLGLSLHQREVLECKNSLRLKRLENDGVLIPPIRTGLGSAGQCMAFSEMNRMFDGGLRKLNRVWKR